MQKSFKNLTSPQQSIWTTEQYYKNTNINNVSGVFVTTVPVDLSVLEKAIKLFVKDNESFRIKLTLENGNIKQYISDYSDFPIETVILKSDDDRIALEEKQNSNGFELLNSNLFRFTLFQYPNGNGGYIVNQSHIISDSWTSGIMVNEICKIYDCLKNKTQIPSKSSELSYSNYIKTEEEYLNSENFKKDKEYWNSIFETVPEIASIPSINNVKDTNISCTAKRYLTNISPNKLKALQNYSSIHKVSLYNIFMGIFALYISRVSNLDNFVIGTPILNRTNFKEKQTTGMFINVLPLKINVNNNQKFKDFVSQISIDSKGLLRHQRYSYNHIIEDLRKRDSSIPTLYNVLFSYQVTKMNETNNVLPHKTSWTFNKSISDDLDFHIFEWNDTNTLQIAYDYKVDKYSDEEISSINQRILYILEQILDNEDVLIKEIDIVTKEEKNKILYEFNNTRTNYPNNKTISQLFEEQVKKAPNNIATVFENQKLTYKELNEKSNQLANYLLDNGVKQGDVIGIFIDKSIEMIVSMLAILKANCCFLPFDIDYPKERIDYIVNDSNVKYILTFNHLKQFLPDISIDVSFENGNIYSSKYSKTNLDLKNYSSENIIYIIYTSGSTGKPKGVLVKHKNIARLVLNQNFINFNSNEIMVQTGTIAFDACIFEIFGALLHGFKLHILKKDILLNINKFEEFLIQNKITILFLTTGLFNELGNLNPQIFKNLRYLMTGGDVISISAVSNILKTCPKLKLVNCYGPTENGSYSTCFNIPSDWNQNYIPIGKPIANSTAYIVSKSGNLQPIGIPGELWVGGDGIGKGYVNRDDLTKKSFIKSPFNSDFIYKTGDLVKYDSFGNICFISRIDNQIKLRGFRIELGEIDSSILKFDNIKESLTIVKKSENTSSIFSYITSDKNIDINELKKYLSKNLPKYMIPNDIIQISSFPLNINGKIDRNLLPVPNIKNNKKNIKPRNEIDNKLIDILSNILNINSSKINLIDNFLDLGGDSLSAINLSAKIYSIFNADILVKDIIQSHTLLEISDLISSKLSNSNNNKLINIPKSDYYNISYSQRNIYMASQIEGKDSLAYNIPGGVIFDKLPDIDKLEECFNKLIERHESFRTYFDIENKEIVQKILEKVELKLEISKKVISEADIHSEFQDFIKPFDFSKAPLLHTKLFKINNGKTILFIDMHHIISDGTSLSIFINELCKLYNGQKLEKLKFTYKDFAYWENNYINSEDSKEAELFWVNQFKDDIPLLNMPTNYPRPIIKSYEGSKVYSTIDSETFEKINKVCKELSITPYMFLLSIYYILLSKYTNQDDIIVGSPIVGRNFSELYNIIGMFVNTIPIRATINQELNFKEFLNNIKEICLNNYKYQNYPLNKIISNLNIQRDSSRMPLFDTVFIYQNNGLTNFNFDNINSKFYIPDTKSSKYDLSLEIIPQDNNLNLNFEYCTKLFTEQFIENFAEHYKIILNIVLNNLNIPISSICILTEKEKNKIINEFNNTNINYPENIDIINLFEKNVLKNPNNVAITFENQKLTYLELNQKANSLARFLIEKNITKNDFVSILLDRSPNIIISVYAVIKAGASYVIIDKEYPEERINYIINDCNSKFTINDDLINNFDFSKYNNDNLNIEENNRLCIIYTSGSTGTPKGVLLRKYGYYNLINAFETDFNISQYKRILSIATVSFDMFAFEMFASTLLGNTLILANSDEQKNPIAMSNLIKNNNVEFFVTTPSRAELLLLEECNNSLKNVKAILFGGEKFTNNLYERLKNVTSAKIFNSYGPTEITSACTNKLITSNDITIGKPLPNTKVYICDSKLHLLPIGVTGEMCVGGIGVADGYSNNEKATKEHFVDNPYGKGKLYRTGDLARYREDGELEYIDRLDDQIKIRGLRIELGEIESIILKYPNIKKAIVIKQVINNREFLSAYYISNKKIVNSELRKYISKYLPNYMVPSYYTHLDNFKYTQNGKIDKKSLPLPQGILSTSSENYIPPKTDLQKKLVSIWEKILNTKPIGINDNFFELGGDSLLAMNLNIELLKITSKITYADIFQFPTIVELEEKIISDKTKPLFNKIENLPEAYQDILEKNIKQDKIYTYSPKGILLTGATGFLGIHILKQFLDNTNLNIYCIVREQPGITVTTKLLEKMNYYFGNKYDNLINNRIFAIRGNVSIQGFGLNQDNLLNLANSIDTVIHCAANVSHFGNYKDFYDSNVVSTKLIINFCKSFNKRLYHISTTGIGGSELDLSYLKNKNDKKQTVKFDESSLYIGQILNNVYTRSKFEAENYVLDAINTGLDAYILRMGNLMPRYSDGIFQENIQDNAFLNKFVSFIKTGIMPDYMLKHILNFTPIDYASNAVYKLISHPSNNNRIFHIYNNKNISVKKYLKKSEFKVTILSEENFVKEVRKILENELEKESIKNLIDDFDNNFHLSYVNDIITQSKFTTKYLRKTHFKWPKISKGYIKKFDNILRRVIE